MLRSHTKLFGKRTHGPVRQAKYFLHLFPCEFATAFFRKMTNVAPLFASGRPFAILRRVAAIVVDSFECQAFRLDAHVVKKVLEVGPALADRDATATVASIGGIFRIAATPDCAAPRFVSWTTGTLCVSVKKH